MLPAPSGRGYSSDATECLLFQACFPSTFVSRYGNVSVRYACLLAVTKGRSRLGRNSLVIIPCMTRHWGVSGTVRLSCSTQNPDLLLSKVSNTIGWGTVSVRLSYHIGVLGFTNAGSHCTAYVSLYRRRKIGARPSSWVQALSLPWHGGSGSILRFRPVQKTARIPFFPLLSFHRFSPCPCKAIIFSRLPNLFRSFYQSSPSLPLGVSPPAPIRQCSRTPHPHSRMPPLTPQLLMFLPLCIIPDYFVLVAVLFSSLCIEGADASPVPLQWGTGGGLVRRITVAESTTTSGMSPHVAQGLSYALITLAVLIGLIVLAYRSRAWHRQRHGSPTPTPPFLFNRPSSGSIPVIMSPRTADIVAKNPSAYGTPASDHAMPHWTRHFHALAPPTPPPPAYSAAIGPANGNALQRA